MIEELTQLIQSNKQILFVGIGNVLKKDDGVGVYICSNINTLNNIDKLCVEQSIENYIGKINKLKPDMLILIDCVNFNKVPGYFDLLDVKDLVDQTTNTHNISLKQISLLFHMPVLILGIQPGDVSFGEGITSKVLESADTILSTLNSSILSK